jgi:hypothetical protein
MDHPRTCLARMPYLYIDQPSFVILGIKSSIFLHSKFLLCKHQSPQTFPGVVLRDSITINFGEQIYYICTHSKVGQSGLHERLGLLIQSRKHNGIWIV